MYRTGKPQVWPTTLVLNLGGILMASLWAIPGVLPFGNYSPTSEKKLEGSASPKQLIC